MKMIDCIQGSPEWHAARCGRVTASRIADIVRQTKTGVSKMRQTYLGEIVAECLSGTQQEGFVSAAMQHGKETEDAARQMYEFMRDVTCERVGFVVHPRLDMSGASPDALIGTNGGLEIKCPNSATHIETLRGAPVEPDYIKQMQWNMACAERAWWDFVSFDPRFPADMQMKVVRVSRDETAIAAMETEVAKFLAEVDAAVADLIARYRHSEAA